MSKLFLDYAIVTILAAAVTIVGQSGLASERNKYDCLPKEQAVEIAASQSSEQTKYIPICIDDALRAQGVDFAYALAFGGLRAYSQAAQAITQTESFFMTLVSAQGHPTKWVNLFFFKNDLNGKLAPNTRVNFAERQDSICAGRYTRMVTSLWHDRHLLPARVCSANLP